MEITINGKKYKVKYTIRALFIFERITNKAFKIETLLDNYLFFYSMILANNKENVLDWEEFLDALDSDKDLFNQLVSISQDVNNRNNIFEGESEDGEKKS